MEIYFEVGQTTKAKRGLKRITLYVIVRKALAWVDVMVPKREIGLISFAANAGNEVEKDNISFMFLKNDFPNRASKKIMEELKPSLRSASGSG